MYIKLAVVEQRGPHGRQLRPGYFRWLSDVALHLVVHIDDFVDRFHHGLLHHAVASGVLVCGATGYNDKLYWLRQHVYLILNLGIIDEIGNAIPRLLGLLEKAHPESIL